MNGFSIDNSAILYLAQMGPDHTNVYRFTVTLTEPVCPETLQKAADLVYGRFPTIFAGFRPESFSYAVVPAAQAPRVEQDPGMLKTMLPEEMERCAYRIYYDHCDIIIEAFHALTDGYGAIASFRTLTAAYLYYRHGIRSPEWTSMLEAGEPRWEEELRDSYLDYADAKPCGLPNRSSYQLPGQGRDWQVKISAESFSTQALLAAAKRSGVSMTTMLSGLMAEAIMEIQKKHTGGTALKPVRIMVPIDLRRQFSSRTFRNFILYALPTLEPGEERLPRPERLRHFQDQIRSQTSREFLAGQVARNVKLQQSPLFRVIPLGIKCAAMRTIYRFFGERNSSITLTNLGPVSLSEELKRYVSGVAVHLTPRRMSPYNCGLITLGDVTNISIARFGARPELEPVFFEKLRNCLES